MLKRLFLLNLVCYHFQLTNFFQKVGIISSTFVPYMENNSNITSNMSRWLIVCTLCGIITGGAYVLGKRYFYQDGGLFLFSISSYFVGKVNTFFLFTNIVDFFPFFFLQLQYTTKGIIKIYINTLTKTIHKECLQIKLYFEQVTLFSNIRAQYILSQYWLAIYMAGWHGLLARFKLQKEVTNVFHSRDIAYIVNRLGALTYFAWPNFRLENSKKLDYSQQQDA